MERHIAGQRATRRGDSYVARRRIRWNRSANECVGHCREVRLNSVNRDTAGSGEVLSEDGPSLPDLAVAMHKSHEGSESHV